MQECKVGTIYVGLLCWMQKIWESIVIIGVGKYRAMCIN